jgi:hypothetical protein
LNEENMKHLVSSCRGVWGVVAAVAIGGALVIIAPSNAMADGAAGECGSKENPCPLQKWMRANLATALASGDTAALASNLKKVAATSPDKAWTWSKLATDGADAAAKGDLAGAKASCKTCHDAYKDQYKAKFRTKAPPT